MMGLEFSNEKGGFIEDCLSQHFVYDIEPLCSFNCQFDEKQLAQVVSSAPFTPRGRENGTFDVIQPPNN